MAGSCVLLVSHYASIVSYANKAVTLNRYESPTSIPFGRSRQDVNRKCSEQHPKQALPRENRIAKRNLVPAGARRNERVRFSDLPCTGGFEVSFGRLVLCFFVSVWGSGMPFCVSSCTCGFEVPFGR